jgi:hypothetical protein
MTGVKNPVSITEWLCSCAVGQDLCHHIVALLYTVSHYQKLNIVSVPPDVSKTSLPQVLETYYCTQCKCVNHPRVLTLSPDLTCQ